MGVTQVPGASRGGRLRLTRRGRAVVTILLLLLVAAAAAVLSPASRASRPGSGVAHATAPAAVVVGPGDSLWSLAERHRPDRDPATVVDEIRRLNRMDGYLVYVGQRLLLPADR
ncbi:LysM peptidoglycan-binding domain-containing protein [Plantactinospora sp. B24E8]|uniref:LysM peptidoglycan-binding domain-containing protein n=1 Tax=Plantactinospora sp. B24E8 TaxID=3153567 RepID=UPI00325D5B81